MSTPVEPRIHGHRNKIPYGVRFIRWIGRERAAAYRGSVLILTFFAYTTYHLSRKPISVVKGTLNPNCSKANPSCHGWKPFNSVDSGDELLGALDLAFLFSYAVGMFFSGFLAEHMDLRHFLTIGMILSGLLTIAFGMGYVWNIHYFAYFVTVQVFSGFFQSSGWPSVVECVGNWFGKGRRGLIMGIWNSHTSVGNILGSAIAGIWASNQWGYSFIVPGCIISGMAVIIFLFLVVDPSHVGLSSPTQHREVEPHQVDTSVNSQRFMESTISEREDLLKEKINGGSADVKIKQLPDDSSSSEASSTVTNTADVPAVSFWRAVLIPGVIEYSLCLFFAKLVSYTFLFWLPFYIQNTRIGGKVYGATTAADLSTLFDVGGIIGGIFAGFVSDKTKCSGITVVFMLILAAPMLFIYRFLANSSLQTNIFLMIATGLFVNGPYALITTAVSANLGTHPCLHGNTKAMATVTAIIDGTGSMGAALGPLLTGIISPTGWNNVFYMLITADVLAAISALSLTLCGIWHSFGPPGTRKRTRASTTKLSKPATKRCLLSIAKQTQEEDYVASGY
ncbi:glucose-6-phosphate exchanger SLC37A2-like isoform X1 [Porites lutea]|uniref:glucose-6-phosphate exchanger SLC37A2-like isoform X1 n=1 Tax=Porites lutea TaxID=51062 RepID=UPI003CC61C4B